MVRYLLFVEVCSICKVKVLFDASYIPDTFKITVPACVYQFINCFILFALRFPALLLRSFALLIYKNIYSACSLARA